MTTQSFPAGDAPRIVIGNCYADLEIEVWDQRAIELESEERIGRVDQHGEGLTITSPSDDLVLRVPADAEVIADDVKGDVRAEGFRALTLTNASGDVEIADLSGPARLERVAGNVEIRAVAAVVLAGKIDGDLTIRDAGVVEIEQVSGDLDVSGAQTVEADKIGGDCSVAASELFRYGKIGGDLRVEGGARVALAGGAVGGDAEIHGVASAHIGDIGGDATIGDIAGDLLIGSVGGDATINDVAGDVRLGSVGGDANVNARHADVRIGNVGGDLRLSSAFPAGSVTGVNVGGDATIELPRDASLALRATVGGDVRGEQIVRSGGGMFTAVYGEGAARLDLLVGGDLALLGDGAPRSSSAAGGWASFGEDLGRMGADLGREISQMGVELERELSGMFGPHGKYSSDTWERKVKQRAEEQLRRAEQRARRAAESAGRHAGDFSGRMHVRINDREWRFDPERLERMKQQARDAAREGVSGAIAAMERALAGLGVPPEPPRPPSPPAPASAPQPPRPPMTGQTIRIDAMPQRETAPEPQPAQQAGEPARNAEEERAAILQMIAEGRLSPEEGDMLLDALGS